MHDHAGYFADTIGPVDLEYGGRDNAARRKVSGHQPKTILGLDERRHDRRIRTERNGIVFFVHEGVQAEKLLFIAGNGRLNGDVLRNALAPKGPSCGLNPVR